MAKYGWEGKAAAAAGNAINWGWVDGNADRNLAKWWKELASGKRFPKKMISSQLTFGREADEG